VAGKPITVHQIEWLKKYGVKEFILSVGYLKEKFLEELGSGRKLGVSIAYVVEDEPLGTGGGLKNAKPLLERESHFYVVNGDILTDIDPTRLFSRFDEDILGVVALVPLPSPYGVVKVGEGSKVLEFEEKPMLRDYWINAGLYLFKPQILEHLPDTGDLERTTFPKLAREGVLKAFKYENVGFWKSIDTVKDVEEAEKILRSTEP